MGCVGRAIGRGARLLIVVQAILGMEVEVVSDPGASGLWLDRLCTAFETLLASPTAMQETLPVEDIAPVLALTSDLGMPLAVNESVAPRHRKLSAGV
ncbi:KH domain-containing protein, partial [Singulisphaera rosea]